MNLYLTADRIGLPTGGGKVTYYEAQALANAFLEVGLMGNETPTDNNPFRQDSDILKWLKRQDLSRTKLAHCYAGCLSACVSYLRKKGIKVTYTAAAHDVQLSKAEHDAINQPFDYPHLTNPLLWKEYVRGYLEADVLIVPSTHSAQVMRKYGREGRIEVIPHGVETNYARPKQPLPDKFTVGYLGAVGPDKGLRYLLEAWKILDYPDATLVIGGANSTSQYTRNLVSLFGGGDIHLLGWLDNVSDFYNQISLYVQPSVTEGFGIEVLEAMAHYKPVICSTGAGASDCVPDGYKFEARSASKIASRIDVVRNVLRGVRKDWFDLWRLRALDYDWHKVSDRYKNLWRSL